MDKTQSIDFTPWLNPFCGMELYPHLPHNKRGQENGVLTLAHLNMLLNEIGLLTDEQKKFARLVVKNISSFDENRDKVKGLYDRGQNESLLSSKHPKIWVKKISHDNITAIKCESFRENKEWHNEIAKRGITTGMAYDNVFPNKPRIVYRNNKKSPKNPKGEWDTAYQLHPRDIFFWLYLSKYWLLILPFVWFLFPIFLISEILECFLPKDNTSTKLLLILRAENTYKKSLLMRFSRHICYKILKKKIWS